MYKYVQMLTALLTSPGVIFHEYAHKEAAESQNMKVSEVCYFQFGDPAGYVTHQSPKSYTGMFIISAAPFILNTSFAFTIFFSASAYIQSVGYASLTRVPIVLLGVLTWIGICLCLHAFPSPQDISNIRDSAKRKWSQKPFGILGTPIFLVRQFSIILSLPIILILVLLNKFRRFGSNIAFTIGVAYLAHITTQMTIIS